MIGTGKVGEQTAAQLTDLGHQVVSVGVAKIKDGVPGASFVFICLETLLEIESAAFEAGRHVSHNAYVVVRGNLSIGVSRVVKDMVDQGIENSGRETVLVNVVTASSPVLPDRIVVGVDELWAGELVLDLYKNLNCPKFVVGAEAAELASYARKEFLQLKTSFIDSVAEMSLQSGVDPEEVIKVAGLDK